MSPPLTVQQRLDGVHARLLAFNQHWYGRVVTALFVLGTTLQMYQYLNATLQPRFDLMTDLDRAIPFWPSTMVIYQSYYVMLVVAAAVVSSRDFVHLLFAALAANFICYAGFYFFTAHFPRPDLAAIAPQWRDLYSWVFGQDGPGNTFPSIHVASTTVVALVLLPRKFGVLWGLWGLAICLSTMTVKQHFVLDVLGGWVVAAIVYPLVFRARQPGVPAR